MTTAPTQGTLWPTPGEGAGETCRSPICAYERHCGSLARLGPPVRQDDAINRTIECLHCGATGTRSERTDGAP